MTIGYMSVLTCGFYTSPALSKLVGGLYGPPL